MKDDIRVVRPQRNRRRRKPAVPRWIRSLRTKPLFTVATIKFDPLTGAQRERFEELQAECEDLQGERIGASEWELCRIDPELERVEAELFWINTDVLWFGGWLEDKAPSRRGRPIDPEIRFRDKRIAAHSLLLELEGEPTEAAVAAVMKLYRVPRSTVFAARKKWLPHLRATLCRFSSQERKSRMWMFEWGLRNLLLQSK
jgi:hypothetical protein